MNVEAAGDTHIGQVRKGNEDSYFVGESVFAVADGMGGHVAGEVASESALEPVGELDGKIFADAEAAGSSLRAAVEEANHRVIEQASDDPRLRGMGTTLTAVMVEGRRLHVAHVGDSRLYLLRDGQFEQLTRDHTLVQNLVDEGQITPEEAAAHPQRSIITRAIGVSRDLEVDTLTVSIQDGDTLLLCSDGLTGVVGDKEIAETVDEADLEQSVSMLIDEANDRGGPDNITVVLCRFVEDRAPDALAAAPAGEASAETADETAADDDRETTGELEEQPSGAVKVTTRDDRTTDDWARRLGRFGSLGDDHTEPTYAPDVDEPTGPSTGRRALAVLVGLAILLAIVVVGGRWLVARSYYVGLSGQDVVIYQGVPTDLGPIDLSWVHETTELDSGDLPEFYAERLEDGIPAADLADARRIVENAPRTGEQATDGAG